MFHWAIAGTLLLGAPALKNAPEMVRPPDGPWTLERAELDGVVFGPKEHGPGCVWRFTPTDCILEQNGIQIEIESATYLTVGGVQAVDFRVKDQPEVKRAIWKLNGDTLTICESAPDTDRPKEYAAPKGSKNSLFVLKRIKE